MGIFFSTSFNILNFQSYNLMLNVVAAFFDQNCQKTTFCVPLALRDWCPLWGENVIARGDDVSQMSWPAVPDRHPMRENKSVW